jgi:hypothetical protein
MKSVYNVDFYIDFTPMERCTSQLGIGGTGVNCNISKIANVIVALARIVVGLSRKIFLLWAAEQDVRALELEFCVLLVGNFHSTKGKYSIFFVLYTCWTAHETVIYYHTFKAHFNTSQLVSH